ncbi:T9SS type A sorting domain-containing protein [Aquimarina sp. W85]|uniref:T9SS type A sorting domain-containing protein n=1 Tax=Aquimarina rhodophyticola TaxID=3342246 RepID=UPI003672E50B
MIEFYSKKQFFKFFTMLLLLLYSIALAASPDCPIMDKDFHSINGTTVDTSPDGWYLDASKVQNATYFEVRSNRLHAEHLGGEGIWYSREVSAQGYSDFQVSVKVHSEGDMNSSEYVKIYYRIDGGPEQLLDQRTGNFGTIDFISEELNGNKVQLIVKLYNYDNGGSQTSKYHIEEYRLFKEEGPCETSTIGVVASASNNGVISCANSSIQLFASTTATNPSFSWTGPNNFTSTLQNPIVSTPGTYRVTVTSSNGTATDVVTVSSSTNAGGSNVVWHENFQHANGTTSDSGASGWSLQNTGTGTFSIQNNELVASFGATNEGIWISEAVDISSFSSVTISADLKSETLTGNGFEDADFIKVGYILNNGSEQTFFENTAGLGTEIMGTATAVAVSQPLQGQTLQVVIRLKNSFTDEFYTIRDVKIEGEIARTQTIWNETFNLSNGTSSDNGTTGWSLQNTGSGTFSVQNNELVASFGSTNEGIWISESINIASFSDVKVSVDLRSETTGSGSFEAADFIKVGYILNNGSEQIFFQDTGGLGDQMSGIATAMAESPALQGQTIQVVVRLKNSATDEKYIVRDIKVEGTTSGAQAVWVEDFSLGNGTTTDTGDTSWSVQKPSSAIFNVSNNTFVISGIGTSGEGVWTSEAIDISNLSNIKVSLGTRSSVTDGGVMNDTGDVLDYIKFYYKIDNGSEVLFSERIGAINNHNSSYTTISSNSLSTGQTLRIIVKARATGDNEFYYMDNVGVIAADSTTGLQASAQVNGTLSCTQSSVTINGNANVSNATYSWVGPNGFTSSNQNITVGTAGNYTLTVSNGDCSDSVTVSVQGSGEIPDITASASGILGCNTSAVSLTGNSNTPGVTYEWSGPNGFATNSQVTQVSVPGEYTFTVTLGNSGCSSSQIVEVKSVSVGGEDQTIWLENFNDLSNGTIQDNGDTAWNSDTSGIESGFMEVRGQQFVINGSNYDSSIGQGVWTSEVINISSYSDITVSMDIDGEGSLDSGQDYFRVYYKLNNGSEQFFINGDKDGAFSSETIRTPVLNGNTLQIIVRSLSTGDSEFYYFDNIEVIGDGASALEAEAIVDGVLSCSNPQVPIRGGASEPDVTYSWTGPQGFTSTSQNIVVGVAGDYILTVTSPSGCTATATGRVTGDPSSFEEYNLIWLENFNDLSNQTQTDNGSTAWSTSNPSGNGRLEVLNNAFIVSNIGPGNEGVWSSEVIDIENLNDVNVSLNICSTTGMESSGSSLDYLRLYYKIDGQAEVLFSESLGVINNGSANGSDIVVNNLNGNTLQLIARSTTTDVSEIYYLDNIKVDNTILVDGIDIDATVNGVINCFSPTVTLTGNSTTPNVTYSWTGPNGFNENTRIVEVSTAGNYILTVSLSGGCSKTTSIEVEEDKDRPVVSTTVSGDITCVIPIVTLTGNSTTPNVSYNWTGPNGFNENTRVVEASEGGDYTLKVTAANGCFSTKTVTVNEDKDEPTISTAVDGELSCNVTEVTLTGNSTTPNVTYNWTGPSGLTVNSRIIEVGLRGNYTLRVTAPNGCFITEVIEVEEDKEQPVVSTSVSGDITCVIPIVTLTGNSTTPNVSYNWTGPNGFNENTRIVEASEGGDYTLKITAANGCFSTKTVTVNEDKDVPTLSASVNGDITCSVSTVTLTGNSTVPNVSYNWTGPNGFNVNSRVVNVGTSGEYTLTVTKANGCFAKQTIEVEEDNDRPVVSTSVSGDITCVIPIVTLTGNSTTPNVSYNWTGPNGFNENTRVVEASEGGDYTLKITAANGCFSTKTVTVNEDKDVPTLSASVNGDITCSVSTVTLTGNSTVPNVSYNWTGPNGFNVNSRVVNVGTSGEYTLTVTKANGCFAKQTIEVEEDNDRPVVSTSVSGDITCVIPIVTLTGNSTTPNVSYNWTGPNGFNENTRVVEASEGGDYTLKVTAANGCFSTKTVTVEENKDEPNISATVDGAIGCSDATRIASVVTLTGNSTTPNVSYVWTGPNGFNENTRIVEVFEGGDYTLRVTAVNGCFSTETVNVDEDKETPSINASVDGEITCINTEVTLTGSSTTPDVSYQWRGPNGFSSTSAIVVVSEGGEYDLTVTRPNGCSSVAFIEVEENKDEPNISATVDGAIGCSDATRIASVVTLTGNSTTPNVSYVWTGPNGFNENTRIVEVFEGGDYTLRVTAVNGCFSTETVNVDEDKETPSINASVDGEITCINTEVTLTGSSTTPDVSYQWRGPNGFSSTSAIVVVSEGGEYDLTVTRPNGCSSVAFIEVEENKDEPNISATVDGAIGCSDATRIASVVTLTGNSTTPNVSYVWTGPNGFNENTRIVEVFEGGDYTLRVTAVNGCFSTETVNVDEDRETPSINASVDGEITCINTEVTLTGSSTTPGVSYQWRGPNGFSSTSAIVVVSEGGEYDLTVTRPNGCSSVAFIEVEENKDEPNISATVDGAIGCSDATRIASVVTLTGNSTTPNVSYVWTGPNGFNENTRIVEVFEGGDYTLRVTAANGCFSTETVNVDEDKETPSINASVDGEITCINTEVTLTGSSTTPGVSYQWRGPNGFSSTSAIVVVSEGGEYDLTVTRPNGCSSVAFIEVEENKNEPNISATVDGAIGCSDATRIASVVTLTGNSTTPNVSYNWTGPNGFNENTRIVEVFEGGDYTLRVTAANGCFSTETVNVDEDKETPSINASVDGEITCINTEVTLTGSSTTPDVSYQWRGPNGFSSTSAIVVVSEGGEYDLTVTRPNGCSSVAFIEVEENKDEPNISATVDGAIGCSDATRIASVVTLTGNSTTPNVSYNWTGPNGFNENTRIVEVFEGGDYTLRVTAANGCFSTETVNVDEDKETPSINASVDGEITCINTEVTLTGSSTTPDVSYQWRGPNGFSSTSAIVVVSEGGEYDLTVTRPNGCSSVAFIEVEENKDEPNISATVDGSISCSVSVVTLIGNSTTSNVSYAWKDPNGVVFNTKNLEVNAAGIYTLTVTAPNGCSVSQTAEVISSIAGGTEILWLEDFEDLEDGTIIDIGDTAWSLDYTGNSLRSMVVNNQFKSYGLLARRSIWKSETIDISSFKDVNVTLDFEASGSLELNQDYFRVYYILDNGGETLFYEYSDPEVSRISSPFLEGSELQIVIHQFNTGTDEVYIFDNIKVSGERSNEVEVSTSVEGALTCVDNEVIITAISAIEDVSYLWEGPNGFVSTLKSITVSTEGDYSLTVTTPSGCSGSTIRTIERDDALPQLTTTITNNGNIDCNFNEVAVTINTDISNATILWEGTALAGNTVSVDAAGTYTVVVEDPTTGCSTEDVVLIEDIRNTPSITTVVENNGVITCAFETLAVTINTDISNATILWEGTALAGNTVSVDAAGTYTVVVEDPTTGCSTEDVVLIEDIRNTPSITTVVENNGVITCDFESLTVTINTDISNATILWEGTALAGNTVHVDAAGTYTVVVEDPTTGCSTEDVVLIEDIRNTPSITTVVENNGVITCDFETLAVTINTDISNATILWEGTALAGNTVSVDAAGTYTVVVEDPTTGCSTEDVVLIEDIRNTPSITTVVENNGVITCAFETLAVTINTDISNATILWEGTALAGNTVSVDAAGTYTVVVEDPTTGCSTEDVVLIEDIRNTPSITTVVENNGVITCAFETLAVTINTDISNATILWEGTALAGNTVSVDAAGTYTVVVEDPTTGCSTEDVVLIEDIRNTPSITTVVENNGVITCAFETLAVTINTDISNATILWEGTALAGNTVSVDAAGTYTVVVEDPTTGCSTEDVVLIEDIRNTPSITTVVENNGVITCDFERLLIIINTDISNATILWEGTALAGNTVHVDAAGTYTVVVEDPTTGCSTEDVVLIEDIRNTPSITTVVENNGVITCAFETLAVTINTDISNATILWEGTALAGNTVSVDAAGTYTVVVEDPATGCSTEDVVLIEDIRNTPSITTVVENNGVITCAFETLAVTINTDISNATILWEGTALAGNTVSVDAAGTYTVVVEDPATGCSTEDVVLIEDIRNTPSITTVVENNGVITCAFETLTVTINTDISNATILWEGTALAGNTVSVDAAGTYTVVVEDPTTGCSTEDVVLIEDIRNTPSITTVVENNGVITCAFETLTVTINTDISNATILWEGTALAGNTVSVDAAGTYTVVVEDPTTGCTTEDVVVIEDIRNTPSITTVVENNGVITCDFETLAVTINTDISNATILWEGTALAGNTVHVDAAGTYTVVVEDPTTGCTTEDVVLIEDIRNTPSITTVVENNGVITCAFETLAVTINTDISNATILWEGTALAGNTVSVDAAGTYTVVVEDPATGCSTEDVVLIEDIRNTPSITTVVENNGVITCAFETLAVTINTDISNATILWEGTALAGNTVSVDAAGTYTVVVEDPATGCSTEDVVLIEDIRNTPSITTVVENNGVITCAFETLTVTINTDISNATILWEGTALAGNTVSVDAAGTYTVVVEDPTTGCSTEDVVLIEDIRNTPSITTVVENNGVITCAFETLTVTINTDISNATILWEGTALAGNTVSVDAAGTYTVVVEDPTTGCTTEDVVVIEDIRNTPSITTVVENNGVITCDFETLAVTINTDISNATILWEGTALAANTVSVDAAGTYTVVVEDPTTGCSTEDVVLIEDIRNTPSVTTVVENNGVITCDFERLLIIINTDISNATILWEGTALAGNTVHVDAAGTYTVVVEDPTTGCTTEDVVLIEDIRNEPSVTTVVENNGVITCAFETLTVTIDTDISNATILWEGTALAGNTVSVDAAGTYTVVVEDPTTGCTTEDVVLIEDIRNTPSITTVVENNGVITCDFERLLIIINTDISNATILWEGTALAGNTVHVDAAGTYTVVVEDPTTGCSTEDVVLIEDIRNTPSITTVVENNGVITCAFETLAVTINTDISNATILWEGTALAGNTVSVDAAGTYTVVVEDPTTGCSTEDVVLIEDIRNTPSITTVVENNGVITCDFESLTVTINTDISNATILWEGTALAGNTVSVDAAGTYTVVVEDPTTGCSTEDVVLIEDIRNTPSITTVVENNGVITCDFETLTVTINTDISNATILWEGTALAGNTVSVDAAGTYTVVVEDPTTGCSTEDVVLIEDIRNTPSITTVVENNGVITCAFETLTVTINTDISNATILWEGTALAGNTVSVDAAGTYTVVVEDPTTGCTTEDVVVIEDIRNTPSITTVVENNGVITCDFETLAVTINTDISNATILWEGTALAGNTVHVDAAGTYTVVVEDPTTGCSTEDVVLIEDIRNTPSITTVVENNGVITCDFETLTVTINTDISNATILWEGTALAGNTVSVDAAGTYTVVVEDPTTGCTTEDVVLIEDIRNTPSITTVVENNGVITCDFETLAVTINTDISNATILWEGTALAGNTVSVDAAGTYTVVVEDPTTGCSTEDVVLIEDIRNTPSITTVVENNGVITCDFETLAVTINTDISNATILWEGTALAANTVSVDAAGTYTVVVEDPTTGCTTEDVVLIEDIRNTPSITTVVENNGVITCDFETLAVTINTDISNATILWEGTALAANTVSVDAAGTYTVVVEDPTTGCSTEDVVLIEESQSELNVSIDVSNDRVIDCTSEEVVVTFTTSISNPTILWNGTALSGNSLTVSSGGTYDVLVTDNDNASCSFETVVTIDDLRSVPVYSVSRECLANGAILLTASSENPDITFKWSVGSEGDSTIEVTASGRYDIDVIDTKTGCSDIGRIRVSDNEIGDCSRGASERISTTSSILNNFEVELDVFPNPAQGPVNIMFNSTEKGTAKLEVYSTSGVLIKTLFDGEVEAFKEYKAIFNEYGSLPSAMYFCKLTLNDRVVTDKIILSDQ